jgi:hypothetical protein
MRGVLFVSEDRQLLSVSETAFETPTMKGHVRRDLTSADGRPRRHSLDWAEALCPCQGVETPDLVSMEEWGN